MSILKIEYTNNEGFTKSYRFTEVAWSNRQEIAELSDERINKICETQGDVRYAKRVRDELIKLKDKKVEVFYLVN